MVSKIKPNYQVVNSWQLILSFANIRCYSKKKKKHCTFFTGEKLKIKLAYYLLRYKYINMSIHITMIA